MGNPIFKVGQYVDVFHCDELESVKDVFMAEAKLLSKITIGKKMVLSTIEECSKGKEVDLGIVNTTLNYKKGISIIVHTEQGWWYIVRNENLETLLGGPLEWGD